MNTPPQTTLEKQPTEFKGLIQSVSQWLYGLETPLEQCLIALLCGGHVLFEGPPGTAKTMLVKLLAQSVQCPFNRVQFTSDMMPADVIGTNVFNRQTNEFQFNQGPIFTTFLLADEINRAPAKTQSSLLESMQEKQVTVDGVRYNLPDLFTVFATQNPIEQEGTYPLPEAQLDRFIFKTIFPYPTKESEIAILKKHHRQDPQGKDIQIQPVVTAEALLKLREEVNNRDVEDSIINYVAELAEQTREHPSIAIGASPRAAIMWLKAAKAKAFMEGRGYIIPDDIKYVSKPLLRHRLILFPQAELEGKNTDNIIDELFMKVQPPR